MIMLCTRCVLFSAHSISVSAAVPCAVVKGFCACSIAAEAQRPQQFAGKVSYRAKNTPLISEASSLSMMLYRNVLQVFIRHLAVQEVGGLSTCYMCTADGKQSARKKKDSFSQDSQTDMAGNSKREVITHKSGGHNSVSFKMNC